LLLPQIFPIFSVVAPGQAGAALRHLGKLFRTRDTSADCALAVGRAQRRGAGERQAVERELHRQRAQPKRPRAPRRFVGVAQRAGELRPGSSARDLRRGRQDDLGRVRALPDPSQRRRESPAHRLWEDDGDPAVGVGHDAGQHVDVDRRDTPTAAARTSRPASARSTRSATGPSRPFRQMASSRR